MESRLFFLLLPSMIAFEDLIIFCSSGAEGGGASRKTKKKNSNQTWTIYFKLQYCCNLKKKSRFFKKKTCVHAIFTYSAPVNYFIHTPVSLSISSKRIFSVAESLALHCIIPPGALPIFYFDFLATYTQQHSDIILLYQKVCSSHKDSPQQFTKLQIEIDQTETECLLYKLQYEKNESKLRKTFKWHNALNMFTFILFSFFSYFLRLYEFSYEFSCFCVAKKPFVLNTIQTHL